MMKLGRIDIITEVSLLLSHIALSREEHLDSAINVMVHVDQRYNSKQVCDCFYIENFHFYRKPKEAIPVNAQKP